jgi:hypothetical protein
MVEQKKAPSGFEPLFSPAPRRFSDLSEPEREALARRLRLQWACGGDRILARAVHRMIAESKGLAGPRPPR